ncbi:MAG: hypothetical protein Q9216_000699 [Gyalolechia sp. 2 TL-2023]
MATSLKLSCACGHITGSLNLPSSHVPLPLDFCHCSTCRHATGQVFLSSFAISASPGNPFSFKIVGQPVAYETSDTLTRYFCGQCGTSLYNHESRLNSNHIASGIVDRTEGLLEFREHIFVGDTKDGGLSQCVEGIAWSGHPEQSEQLQLPSKSALENTAASRSKSKSKSKSKSNRGEVLECYCQCRGVHFNIIPPGQSSSNVCSPAPDLQGPSYTRSPQDTPDSAWWLRANGTKYRAGTCACNSCRLSSGYDIQAWAFVPEANIRQMNGNEVDYSMGTLKEYSLSEGAYRNFCGTCGATVFWRNDKRHGIVDISAGLLNAEEGARAEHWLEWVTESVGFEELAQNKSLVSRLSSGLKTLQPTTQ